MSERRSISTAPRDGTKVRLFHEGDFQESKLCPTTGSWDGSRWVMNQFFIIDRGGRLVMAKEPTHWLPVEDADAKTADTVPEGEGAMSERNNRVHVVNARRHQDGSFWLVLSDDSEMSWSVWISGGRDDLCAVWKGEPVHAAR